MSVVPPIPDDLGKRPLLDQIAFWWKRGDQYPPGDQRQRCYATAMDLTKLRDAKTKHKRAAQPVPSPRLKP